MINVIEKWLFWISLGSAVTFSGEVKWANL